MKGMEKFSAGMPDFMKKWQFWVGLGVVSIACVAGCAAGGIYDTIATEAPASKEADAVNQEEVKKLEEERLATEKKAEEERPAKEKKEEEERKAAEEAEKKAEEERKTAAQQQTTVQSNSSPADTNASSSTPLPLKAICSDGTVSYQDDPYGENYKGMCSGHGGIKTKLGRVK